MEASVVVEGDLCHDVVRPFVLVVVVRSAGSSHQSTVELVRVRFAGVSKGSPIAGCWDGPAGSSLPVSLILNLLRIYLVVGLLWEVVPVANDVAELPWVVTQHVSNLTTGICSVLGCLDPSIGCLLKEKKVDLNEAELTPRQMKAKLEAYLLEPHWALKVCPPGDLWTARAASQNCSTSFLYLNKKYCKQAHGISWNH